MYDTLTEEYKRSDGFMGTVWHLLRYTTLLFIAWLCVNLLTVGYYWDMDTAPLQQVLDTEKGYIGIGTGSASSQRVDGFIQSGHNLIFVKTGILESLETTSDSFMISLLQGSWFIVETIYISTQLFLLRIGVLLICLPFIAGLALLAITDGGTGWYLRRLSGSRESAFLYHRAKEFTPFLIFALWACYLLPPIAMNPVYVIPPYLIIWAVIFRFRVSLFKKFI